jgi:signal transduction histidine kinase
MTDAVAEAHVDRPDATLERPDALAWQRAAAIVVPPAALAIAAIATTPERRPGFLVLMLLLVVAPLVFRLAWPPAVLLTVTIGTLVTAPGVDAAYVQVAAVALASFTVGELATDRVRSAMLMLGATLGATLIAIALDAEPLEAAAIVSGALIPAWLVGDVVRGRRLADARRAAAAEAAIREREARLVAAAEDERRHVARELHDTVAHAVSVMVVQAGAARQVLRSSPDQAETSLLAVEAAGREAMAELRRMVGALGDDADQGGIAPQPGTNELEALVARVRAAGLPVELEQTGERRPLPAGIDVTAYRVVQEALTNALRHSGGARTLVQLAYLPAELRIEVLDEGGTAAPPTKTGTGRGLDGMRQRVALAGGRLEAGPRLGGGFAVRAWLPLPDDAP